jgi:hypothetical protein
MGRREGAGQQEACVEMRDTPAQNLVFAVKHIGRSRGHFADKEEVAAPKLFRAHAAKPAAPVLWDRKARIGHCPVVRGQLSKGKILAKLNLQADEGVFVAVRDPVARLMICASGQGNIGTSRDWLR